MSEEQRLDGAALDSASAMALLELLNGGPEIGRLSPEDKIKYLALKDRKIGRIMVCSTVEDMSEKKGGENLLWKKPTEE